MSRLVVVSNRVAPVVEGKASAGGLAVGVLAALRQTGGMWFGWSGDLVSDDPGPVAVFETGQVTYATMDLAERDYDEYYNGFANSTLWPLFHYRIDLVNFSRRQYTTYQRVNTLFATRLRPLLKDDDLIWVHDYHLIPLGQELRRNGTENRIGFFLHTPWPALEVLLSLPAHGPLVRALCAYDVIGFHTERDLRSFHDYVRYEAGGQVREDGTISVYGRTLRAAAFPIGVDVENVASMAAVAAQSPQTRRLKETLHERALMVGVDRLDYSKGLVNRFEAFERLLESYPANRGHVILLQIAPPSRTEVQQYIEMRRELETAAGHINGRFADYDWVPIRYLNKGFNRKALVGFLRIADAALVTPLRDGMNLVAKEYVAAQDPENPGVLILSRFAGAAEEMDGALVINPYDTDTVAEAMQRALDMPLEERKERWQTDMDALRRNDISAWRERFMAALAAVPAA